jgi:hypothetical protein
MLKTVPMKTTIRQCIGYLSVVLVFLAVENSSMAADKIPVAGKLVHYSVSFNKTQNNKKHKIRLYSNAASGKVQCSVIGVHGTRYELYVFNMYSQLITQTTILSGETAALDRVSRGNYLFEVLVNDEHIERGQLTVK